MTEERDRKTSKDPFVLYFHIQQFEFDIIKYCFNHQFNIQKTFENLAQILFV